MLFRFKNLIVVASLIIGTFVISELVYIYNKKPQLFSLIYLWRSQKTISNDFSKGVKYLEKAAAINIYFQNQKYPTLIPKNYKPDLNIENDSNLKTKIQSYATGLDITNIASSLQIELSQIFYEIGIISYSTGSTDSLETLLKTARYLSPEFSHYHVELANLYLYSGDVQKAMEAIDFCLNFKSPKKHCEDFNKNNLNTGTFQEPGFLKDVVNSFYKSI